MEPVRDSAIELQSKGLIDICQKGIPVQSSTWTGPIRLRLRQKVVKKKNANREIETDTNEVCTISTYTDEKRDNLKQVNQQRYEPEQQKKNKGRKRKHEVT